MAKSLVELLGGTINLASHSEKGSLFEIVLIQDLYSDQTDEVVFDEEGFWSYDTAVASSS
ncbi:MAG: sensor histidine kinase [Calditrichaeota bacterium]|nr:sensor histidine kinase [Calditrichota bacterium]